MSSEQIKNARRRLLGNYPADDHGVWRIFGEEHNPNVSGPHNEPKLEEVTGTYKNVIEYALNLEGFFSWGYGGRIEKKKCTTKLCNVDLLTDPKVLVLQAEKAKLQLRIEEIDEEIHSLTKE